MASGIASKHLLSNDDDQDIKVDNSVFVFDTPYREVGVRIRIDELTFVNTAQQRYGINLVLDRTWLPSEADLKQWSELRSSGKISEYQPDYVPFILFPNVATTSLAEGLPWEQTLGKYIIQKSSLDGKYYNRYKVKGQYEFTEEFEVENYPFDFQDLSIIICPESATIDQQRLVPHHIIRSYFTLNPTWSSITDWDIVNLYCKEYVLDATKYYTKGHQDDDKLFPNYNKKPKLESWVNYKLQVKRKWRGIMTGVCAWMLLLGKSQESSKIFS